MLATRRDKFLACGISQQQLPRSPTSKIHESIGNRSSKPPRGSRAVVLLGSRVWRGSHWGGELVLVSACSTVSPLITGGQAHTHDIMQTQITHLIQFVKTGSHTSTSQGYFASHLIFLFCDHKIWMSISKFFLIG